MFTFMSLIYLDNNTHNGETTWNIVCGSLLSDVVCFAITLGAMLYLL